MNTPINESFEKSSKYFFWVAGIVTIAGSLPTMLSPSKGFNLTFGLNYIDQSPQLIPIIGHWGTMVVGIGVLLFLSGKIKKLRKSTAIYSTLEKGFLVCGALYCFVIDAPYSTNYIGAIVADSLQAIGGIWYLWRSHHLGQD
jgi:hypothetical protein